MDNRSQLGRHGLVLYRGTKSITIANEDLWDYPRIKKEQNTKLISLEEFTFQ